MSEESDTRYWGIAEVAEHLSITAESAYTYRKRGTLPEPDITLGKSPGWLPATIRAWQESRTRRRAPRTPAQTSPNGP